MRAPFIVLLSFVIACYQGEYSSWDTGVSTDTDAPELPTPDEIDERCNQDNWHGDDYEKRCFCYAVYGEMLGNAHGSVCDSRHWLDALLAGGIGWSAHDRECFASGAEPAYARALAESC